MSNGESEGVQVRGRAPSRLEHQLAVAQKITHTGSWEWSLATGRLHWSDELYRIYGLEPRSCPITFERFLSMVHEDDRARVQGAVRRALESDGRFAHRERIHRPDGSVRELESVGEVVRDDAGVIIGLIGTCRDVTEERRRDEMIRLYANVVENVQIGLSVWNAGDATEAAGLTLAAFNPALERATGVSLSGAVGRALSEVVPALAHTELPETLWRVAVEGRPRELPIFRFASPGFEHRTFSAKAFPLPGHCVGLALEDVTSQTRNRQLQAAEQRVLEMVASGATLESVLSTLILAVERHAPPTMGSILLLDETGTRLHHAAAPHLPGSFTCCLDGELIGPAAGSCGTAAYLGRAVFVTDIATDPLWERYRALAEQHELRACWSTPILSSEGRVLGTFALYYRESRRPGPAELELITRATHVAGIAIQRKQLDDQLRALSARVDAAREDERTAVAREIHDELGQALTALKMDVAWIGRHLPTDPADARDAARRRLDEMTASVDGVIDQVRRISAELRPGVLDDLGLAAAVEWQAREFLGRVDIRCEVHSNVQERHFDRNLSTGLFRILQEALTNVARHAAAHSVQVALMLEGRTLKLSVQDDGQGISKEALSRPSALGVLGMSERARRLGGELALSGEPGAGTLLQVQIPLPEGAT